MDCHSSVLGHVALVAIIGTTRPAPYVLVKSLLIIWKLRPKPSMSIEFIDRRSSNEL